MNKENLVKIRNISRKSKLYFIAGTAVSLIGVLCAGASVNNAGGWDYAPETHTLAVKMIAGIAILCLAGVLTSNSVAAASKKLLQNQKPRVYRHYLPPTQ